MRTPVLLGPHRLVDVVRPLHPIASVYIGSPTGSSWPARLERLVDALLADGADEATVLDFLVAASDEPETPTVVFADGGHVPAAYATPGRRGPDAVRFGAPAHVLPLMAWAQERPSCVVVDARHASVEVATTPGGLETGVRESVWCRPRAVVEVCRESLARFPARLVVVYGEERVAESLRAEFAPVATVRRVRDTGRDRLAEVARSTARLWAAQSLADFDERSGKPGHAVEGVEATLDALARGRVRELLVDIASPDPATAWFGATTRHVLDGKRSAPWARRSGPAIDVAVRAALLGDVPVRVLRPGVPGVPAGGIGALCRFPLAVVRS
ncbi:hypothetical protein FHS29_005118 [Saccharothrix tamanrassetensis]|uniref:Uncharacterized protein n=1 Tax=Saccharothrix tamanrassetensis TaxID=1051531 RepID=A0A841CN11_9PSEU|nr:hypothetical protein [Saccharothrix tamanrassetensis]MBB5958510.1 hypothetical protein [Saccharothrix tamanrassetensis]